MVRIGSDYKAFCKPDCNRRDFIVEYLEKHGIKAVVMPIDGHEHIYVNFSKDSYNPIFKIKTVLAHYDRAPGSPGANDNSSSDFALMDWAISLSRSKVQHNVRLIFTDGEEMTNLSDDAGSSLSGTVTEQGAFGLASLFKRLKITDDDVFVFDCVGRGTVPVIGKTTLPKGLNQKFKDSFFGLRNRVSDILKIASGGNFVTLPISYSDNAGFLACGIPAIAITMLPKEEASQFMTDLVRVPILEDYVMNKRIPDYFGKQQLEEMLPTTWKYFHSQNDNVESLTQESFAVMERILYALANLKTFA